MLMIVDVLRCSSTAHGELSVTTGGTYKMPLLSVDSSAFLGLGRQ